LEKIILNLQQSKKIDFFMDKKPNLKYHHLGIPTSKHIEGEVYLKDHKVYHYGYEKSEYGIEWMRYEKDCQLPEIVKTMPHVAFEVEDIYEAIKGKKVIIEPNSPSEGNIVAFIEENGAPIEFIQIFNK
jgi:alpha-acetolactate decarboxylase